MTALMHGTAGAMVSQSCSAVMVAFYFPLDCAVFPNEKTSLTKALKEESDPCLCSQQVAAFQFLLCVVCASATAQFHMVQKPRCSPFNKRVKMQCLFYFTVSTLDAHSF